MAVIGAVIEKPNRPLLIPENELFSHEGEHTCFHLTHTSNVPSIIRGGLTAQRGPRCQYIGDESGVFLFLDVASLLRHTNPETGWFFRYYGEEPVTLLKVNVEGLSRHSRVNEPNAHWEFVTKDSISPSRIRVVGRYA